MSNMNFNRCTQFSASRGGCFQNCGSGCCMPGPAGPPGPIGPTGPAGPGSATVAIPFSISKYGVSLAFDAQGEPLMVAFSGFGPGYYPSEFLQEGEWATGTITIRPEMFYGTAFIMPHTGTLKSIYALVSTVSDTLFEDGSTIQPFVCLAVSNSDNLVYTILQNTIAHTAPFAGGVVYPTHTNRRGSLTNLNVQIAEGTLVAIVAGIMGQNVTAEQSATFAVSGGLLLE